LTAIELDAGFRMLDPGFWFFDTGYLIDENLKIKHPEARISNSSVVGGVRELLVTKFQLGHEKLPPKLRDYQDQVSSI